MNSFKVVEQFERRVAEFAGAKHAVATMTGTWAIYLALEYRKPKHVILPARTFISVPLAAIHAGATVSFEDRDWRGVYDFNGIIDGALRWRRGMYEGGLHCLSFHARKHINIGEGGMVLTDDAEASKWLRMARYSGRFSPDFRVEDVWFPGWQAYMTPEKAARGLHLMDYVQDEPDQVIEYPDLRNVALFKERAAPTS